MNSSVFANLDVEQLRREAEQGDPHAQVLLGITYRTGKGVPQDLAEAAKWYLKAAEQGEVNAQRYLGYVYLEGEGLPPDFAEAAKWYRRAAEQGDSTAQCIIGWMYAEGRGVPQDFRSAYVWLCVATEHSQTISDEARAEVGESVKVVAEKLEPAQIAEAKAEAARLFSEISKKREQGD